MLSTEQDDAVRQLIVVGEERGDVRPEEIDALLPADVTSSRALHEVVNRCWDAGIEVVDAAPGEPAGARHARTDEADLTPSLPERSTDVVRQYLADMSRVPLLTREEEVVLAKRFEHGKRTVVVALSHTPNLVQQVLRLGDELRGDSRLVRGFVTRRHGEVTADRLERRAREALMQVDAVTAALGGGSREASGVLEEDDHT